MFILLVRQSIEPFPTRLPVLPKRPIVGDLVRERSVRTRPRCPALPCRAAHRDQSDLLENLVGAPRTRPI